MKKNILDQLLNVASIHENHLLRTRKELQKMLPLDKDKVTNFKIEDIEKWDFFVGRFSKLQDLIGAKLFQKVLENLGEVTENLSVIDCIHKLEKLGVEINVSEWQRLRELRNHLAHEYPDAPQITASFLNMSIEAAPRLIEILESLRQLLPKALE